MIIVIEGGTDAEKSELVNRLCADKNRVNINPDTFSFSNVEPDSDIIVVDGIKRKDWEKVYYSFRADFMNIERQSKERVYLKMIDAVLIKY